VTKSVFSIPLFAAERHANRLFRVICACLDEVLAGQVVWNRILTVAGKEFTDM